MVTSNIMIETSLKIEMCLKFLEILSPSIFLKSLLMICPWVLCTYSFHSPFHLLTTYTNNDQYDVDRTTLEISCNSWNIASILRTPLYQSQFFPRPHYWLRFLRFRDDALRTHSYNGCFYLTLVEWRVRLATLAFHDLVYFCEKNYHKKIWFN